MTTTSALVFASMASVMSAQPPSRDEDERTIRLLIQHRETAWNSGDVAGYGRLLTDDADLLSATGRAAESRKAILDLYVEQRTEAYKGGTTATPVESIRFLRPDVAIVNTRFRLTGLHAADGSTLPVRRGLLTLIVTKDQGHWLIASMRGIPETPIH